MFQFATVVTLVTRTAGSPDVYGNPALTEARTTVMGAFAPGSSSEQTTGEQVTVDQPTVYLPAGTVLAPTDAVEVDGRTFEVDGAPRPWQSPFTGWSPGVEVRLRETVT